MSVVPSQSLKDEAAAAIQKGSHKKALRCFTALERLEPENGEWSLQVGVMYHRLGKRRQAIEALQRAAQRCQLQQKNERSYAIYQQILKLDPTNTAAQRGVKSLERQPARRSASRSIQRKAGVKVLPASSATFPTVGEGTPHPVCADETGNDGFGLPKAKSGRVAMALAALKA